MCLESRSAALLVALSSIVTSGGFGLTPSTAGWSATTVAPSFAVFRVSRQQGSNVTGPNGAQIRGRLVSMDRQPLANAALVMTPEDSDGSASSIDGTLVPDGSFVFNNVPPGIYLIRALAQTTPNAPSLFALFRVRVGSSDVDGIELMLRPGATISGRIIIDPRSGVRDPRSGDDTARSTSLMAALAGVRVRAPFSDDGSFGAAQAGEPGRDGTFTVQGVMGGTHLLVLEGLPIPWSVKNVTYRGQDVTDTGLLADSGQRLTEVNISVTDQASEVSGIVRDGDGRIAPDARVLFVPLSPGLWPLASRRYARAITNASGHYSIRGLPIGGYKAMAARELGDRDMYRRDILRTVRDHGVEISLETDQARVVDLSVIELPLQHRVAAR